MYGGQGIQILGLQIRKSRHLAFTSGDDLFELLDADILGRHDTGAIRAMASLAQLRKDRVALRLRGRSMRYTSAGVSAMSLNFSSGESEVRKYIMPVSDRPRRCPSWRRHRLLESGWSYACRFPA